MRMMMMMMMMMPLKGHALEQFSILICFLESLLGKRKGFKMHKCLSLEVLHNLAVGQRIVEHLSVVPWCSGPVEATDIPPVGLPNSTGIFFCFVGSTHDLPPVFQKKRDLIWEIHPEILRTKITSRGIVDGVHNDMVNTTVPLDACLPWQEISIQFYRG